MVCEHWKRCGDCHSPALVAGLREVEESLRRDVERLTSERDAALARCSEYAAGWDAHSARAIDAERERDAAYAASVRTDERHAETVRAVRARAERAEAQVERLRGALRAVVEEHAHRCFECDAIATWREAVDRGGRDKFWCDDCVWIPQKAISKGAPRYQPQRVTFADWFEDARAALADAPTAESSRQRLISALRRGWPCVLPGGDVYGPYLDALHMIADALEQGEDAALADAAVRNDDPDAPNERR